MAAELKNITQVRISLDKTIGSKQKKIIKLENLVLKIHFLLIFSRVALTMQYGFAPIRH